jgi:hypothetical protein
MNIVDGLICVMPSATKGVEKAKIQRRRDRIADGRMATIMEPIGNFGNVGS